MAKNYFNLPARIAAINDNAESFLAHTKNTFDIILSDIYQQEQSPSALFEKPFYVNLVKKLTPTGCALVSININAQQLTSLLTILRRLNLHVSLIDFNDYKNIIVVISKLPLPDKTQLITLNQQHIKSLNIDFSSAIEHMHTLPAAEHFIDQ